ncbi:MAG: gas vesicle protein K [Myxococcota bacterium]|nr:gas vesicle protein K [Myxococcota bacterium]
MEELERLRGRLERGERPGRWNTDAEDAQRGLAKLVLTLVEFLRRLMERQAIRRMDQGTISEEEVERIGLALMRLEETIHELCERFDIPPDELGLDLGPLGKLF